MSSVDDDVPPLENGGVATRGAKEASSIRSEARTTGVAVIEDDEDADSIQVQMINATRAATMVPNKAGDLDKPAALSATAASTELAVANKKEKAVPGLKKGFLLSGSKVSDKKGGAGPSASVAAAGVIHVSKSAEAGERLRFPEVQAAMRAGMGGLKGALADQRNWLTPDLTARMLKDPKLVAGMSSPEFMAAIAELQVNPAKVMQKHKDNAPLQEFLRAFMSLLGDHFTSIGVARGEVAAPASAAASSPAPSGAIAAQGSVITPGAFSRSADAARSIGLTEAVAPKAGAAEPSSGSFGMPFSGMPTSASVDEIVEATASGRIAADDPQVRAVLSDRELMGILGDPEMQRVLKECAEDPARLRFYRGIPAVLDKLKRLQAAGMVRIE